MTKPNKRFCCDYHRIAWHRNRLGLGQLKNLLPRAVAAEVTRQLTELLDNLVRRDELTEEGIALVKAAVERRRKRQSYVAPTD